MNLAKYISHEVKKTIGNNAQVFFNGQLLGELQTLNISGARRSNSPVYELGNSRPTSFAMEDRR